MTRFPEGKQIAVYDLTTLNGNVIYVGITTKPGKRMGAHRRTIPVRCAFVMTIVSWHDDVAAARRTEAARIGKLKPVFNKRGRSPLFKQ